MKLVDELVDACHRVYDSGFVSAYDGNLSLRLDAESILITRSGINKGEVTAKDILTIDNLGNRLAGEGKVTTELKVHLNIYNNRDDINAVIHCHPIYSNAIAITHDVFPNNIFPEAILALGKIPICNYAMPSSDKLAESINPFLDFSNLFLLSNHGAISVGTDISNAFYRMEKLEQISKTIVLAKSIGDVKTLSNQEIEKLYSISNETYGIKIDERNKVNINE